MKSDMLLIILMVVILYVADSQTLYYGRSHHQSHNDPCPHSCRCTPLYTDHKQRGWNSIYGRYRFQRLIFGRSSFQALSLTQSTDGREMTCMGLTQMPTKIPSDIKKLSLLGNIESDVQNDLPLLTDFQYDYPAYTGRQVKSKVKRAHHKTFVHQITQLSKGAFVLAREMNQLAIEGNRIKIVQPRDFEVLYKLKTLSLKNNRIKTLSARAFRGLVNLHSLDLSMNHIEQLARASFTDTPSLKTLKLKENNIFFIDELVFETLKNLEVLDISYNALNDLPFHIFERLHNLTELYLNNNYIQFITWKWFVNSKKLKILKFGGNRLKEIEPPSLATLSSLREISFTGNQIKLIKNGTFQVMTKLKSLDLSNNSISEINGDGFTNLKELRYLTLDHNYLRSINGIFTKDLSKLRELKIALNKIYSIDNVHIGMLKSLERLDLSYNRIQVIQRRTFFGMRHLMTIALNNNEISIVEPKAFALSIVNTMAKLTWISMEYNSLRRLDPMAFYGVHYLKFLNLCHNKIGEITPKTFSKLSNLRTLLLNSNHLRDLSTGSFQKMKKLRTLNMAFNRLGSIPFNTFLGLEVLEDIDLSANQITKLNQDVFLDTPRLRRITLKQNKLKNVDFAVFESMVNLRYLDLKRNKLSSLVLQNIFQGQLKFLSIADNNLKTIDKNVTSLMSRYGYLHLYNNPWLCDCNLKWLRKQMQGWNLQIADKAEVTCRYPVHLYKKQLSNLKDAEMTCKSKKASPATMALKLKSGHICAMSSSDMTSGHKGIRLSKRGLIQYHATIYNRHGIPVCSAVQIDNEWLLGLGTCWVQNITKEDVTSGAITVRIGPSRDKGPRISKLFYHPHMSQGHLNVVLVKLEKREFTRSRNYPCLMTKQQINVIRKHRFRAIITSRLLKTKSPKVKLRASGFKLKNKPLCTASQFICGRSRVYKHQHKYGTTGSPLYIDLGGNGWALAGIENGQHSRNNGWFMPVSTLSEWVEGTIKQNL